MQAKLVESARARHAHFHGRRGLHPQLADLIVGDRLGERIEPLYVGLNARAVLPECRGQ
jgi:hypothetical protein